MNIPRSIGACLLGTAVAVVPLVAVSGADGAFAAPAVATVDAPSSTDFAVTSRPVYAPDGPLTVTGVAPLRQNVWATVSGTDRNAVIAFDSGDSSRSWTLHIPIEYTTGKDQVSLDFHHGDAETITQSFTASEDAVPALAVTSQPVFAPDEALMITGTAPPRQNVWATIAGTDPRDVVAFVTGNDEGTWTLRIPFDQTKGKEELTLDIHSGTKTITQTFTNSPAAATEFEVTSRPVFFPGRTLTVTGTALAWQNVWATVSGTDRNAVIAFDSGDDSTEWKLDIPQRFTAGKERLDLEFHYGADKTITQTFTAEVTAAPITVETETYVKGQRQKIEGTAERGAVIEVWSEGRRLMNVAAGLDGRWSYTTGAPITADTFTRTLKARGTDDITFTLSPEQEEAAPITVTTTTFVRGQKQQIEGTAQPGARVDIYSGSKYLMNVTADKNGTWNYTTGAAITTDTFTRTLKSAGTDDVTFTLTAEQATVAPITVTTTTFVKGQKQKIEGTAQPGARVDIYSGSKYLMNVTADNDGNWDYTTGAAITTDTFTRTLKSAGTDDITFTLQAE